MEIVKALSIGTTTVHSFGTEKWALGPQARGLSCGLSLLVTFLLVPTPVALSSSFRPPHLYWPDLR